MNLNLKPTPYESVNLMVQILFERSHEILGDNILGMYLQGSLATGDFNIKSSDIDFIFALHEKLTEEEVKKIQKMWEEIVKEEVGEEDSKMARQLDGSYIQKDLFKYSGLPEENRDYMNGDGFGLPCGFGYEFVFEKYILYNNPIVVIGPLPRTFIKQVSKDEIIDATIGILYRNWKYFLKADFSNDYKQAHGVLTMCRMLLILTSNKITSKIEAARWVKTEFSQWNNLIEDAIDWVNERHTLKTRPFNREEEVRDLIRFTIEYSKKYGSYKVD